MVVVARPGWQCSDRKDPDRILENLTSSHQDFLPGGMWMWEKEKHPDGSEPWLGTLTRKVGLALCPDAGTFVCQRARQLPLRANSQHDPLGWR